VRVLANLLQLPGFDFDSSQDVLAAVHRRLASGVALDNSTSAALDLTPPRAEPVSAAIYQLDSLVRRSTSLQLTADARNSGQRGVVGEAIA
jgi:NADH-quinone oxidoreductase subunit G